MSKRSFIPASADGWFDTSNRLGAKIGIWADSRCHTLGHALEFSRRVFAAYRDDVVVQPYVNGRNVRASFLGLKPQTGVESAGRCVRGFRPRLLPLPMAAWPRRCDGRSGGE